MVKLKIFNIARRLHLLSSKEKNNINIFDSELTEVDYVIGADLFIRRSIIEELGLFDPDFFMYSEEEEMQKRYSKRGYKSAIIKGPQIVHFTPKVEPGKEIYTCINRYLFYEGKFTYLKKENAYYIYILYRIFFAMTNLTQVFTSRGTLIQRFQFFLFIIGIKTIKHW